MAYAETAFWPTHPYGIPITRGESHDPTPIIASRPETRQRVETRSLPTPSEGTPLWKLLHEHHSRFHIPSQLKAILDEHSSCNPNAATGTALATCKGLHFSDFPIEVRRRIFAFALTKPTIRTPHLPNPNQHTLPAPTVGTVVVLEMPHVDFFASNQRTYYLNTPAQTRHYPHAASYAAAYGFSTQILRVSHAWYADACPQFYARNVFWFESGRALLPFLFDRVGLSRTALEAVSLPMPDVALRVPRLQLGRCFTWNTVPKFTHALALRGGVWEWLCAGFLDSELTLPALRFVDLRVPLVPRTDPPDELGREDVMPLALGRALVKLQSLWLVRITEEREIGVRRFGVNGRVIHDETYKGGLEDVLKFQTPLTCEQRFVMEHFKRVKAKKEHYQGLLLMR